MVQHRAEGVIYLDVNDPQGIGVLLISEDPGWFVAQAQAYIIKRDNAYQLVPQKSWAGTYVNNSKISLPHCISVTKGVK